MVKKEDAKSQKLEFMACGRIVWPLDTLPKYRVTIEPWHTQPEDTRKKDMARIANLYLASERLLDVAKCFRDLINEGFVIGIERWPHVQDMVEKAILRAEGEKW